LLDALRQFHRQALHATRLVLDPPTTGERLEWERPMPGDMLPLVEVMRRDAAEN